jgi:hypothetical protein
MQVSVNQEQKSYQPVTLTLTLETKKEVEAIYQLFNFSPIARVMEKYGINPENIRNNIGAEIEDMHNIQWGSNVISELELQFKKSVK